MLKEFLSSELSSLWLSYYVWTPITDGSLICRSLWIHPRIWDALAHMYQDAIVLTKNTSDLDQIAQLYLRSDINTTFLAFFNGLFSILEAPTTVYIPDIGTFNSLVSKYIPPGVQKVTLTEPTVADLDKNVFADLAQTTKAETYGWLSNTITSFLEGRNA
jgi:hypothetical protein